MTIHELKTWPEYFNHLVIGTKTFEFRKNDRDFKVGDLLLLQEYLPDSKQYTGNELVVRVTFILGLSHRIWETETIVMDPPERPDYVVMGIERMMSKMIN